MRLAGQRRLVHTQPGSLGQAQVCRHKIARLQRHHVAGHQVRGVGFTPVAAAQHLRPRAGQALQRGQGQVGTIFLDEADHRIEHDDDQDDDAVGDIPEQTGDDRRGDQDEDHEVLELAEEHGERPACAPFGQDVGAMPEQTFAGLRLGQAQFGTNLQMLGHPLAGLPMPVSLFSGHRHRWRKR